MSSRLNLIFLLTTAIFINISCLNITVLSKSPRVNITALAKVPLNVTVNNFCMLISGGYRPNSLLVKHIVSIRTTKYFTVFGDNHFCTGCIISRNIILSTAHCYIKNDALVSAKYLRVIAGAPDQFLKTNNTVEMEVSKIITYKQFRSLGQNDIAILRLKGMLPIDKQFIDVIGIGQKRPSFNKFCTTLGWGQLYYRGPLAGRPVFADIKILPDKMCRLAFPLQYTYGMLCVGDPDDWAKDACRGDSGAPIICDNKLVGLASFNFKCGQRPFPTVSTDVTYFRPWIEAHSDANKLNSVAAITFLSIFLAYIFLKEILLLFLSIFVFITS